MNENNFDLAIAAVNVVLQLENDTEKALQRCVDNYEVAYDKYKAAMNYIHTFSYNLEGQPQLISKLKIVLQKLHELLQKHLNKIQANCQVVEDAKPTRDVNSRFIEDAHGPKPFDPSAGTFDYY